MTAGFRQLDDARVSEIRSRLWVGMRFVVNTKWDSPETPFPVLYCDKDLIRFVGLESSDVCPVSKCNRLARASHCFKIRPFLLNYLCVRSCRRGNCEVQITSLRRSNGSGGRIAPLHKRECPPDFYSLRRMFIGFKRD